MFFNDRAYGYPTGFYEPRRAQPYPYARRGFPKQRQPEPVYDPFGFSPQARYQYQPSPHRQHAWQNGQENMEEDTYSHMQEPVRKSRSIPVRVNQSQAKQPPVKRQQDVSEPIDATIAEEREGASLASSPKLFSVASTKTLSSLDKVSEEYSNMVTKVDDIEKSTDLNNATNVLDAKHLLAQIAGNIDKLQFNKLDAIQTTDLNSGKEIARTQRKGLNQSLDALQQRVQKLYKEYSDIAETLVVQSPVSLGESNETEGCGANSSEKEEVQTATTSDEKTEAEEQVDTEIISHDSDMTPDEAPAGNEYVDEASATSMEQEVEDATVEDGWEDVGSSSTGTSPLETITVRADEADISLSKQHIEEEEQEDKDAIIETLKAQLQKKDELISHLMQQLEKNSAQQ